MQRLLFITVLCSFCFIGCLPSSNGVRVHGTVTLDGVPLETGSVTFCEKDSDQSFAGLIKNGKYELTAFSGEKTVRIAATRQKGTTPRNNFPGDTEVDPVFESIIPEKYNAKTTLTCTVDKNGGEQNFELTTK